MNDEQLLRYSRHILLPEIGIEGQERLLCARALVIGAGGLGSPVALYLASAGVGHITICDGDKVDLTNLQRQIVHRTHSIGRTKVDSARATLAEINPEARVVALAERVGGERLDELVDSADVVVDGCDNFATRHAVNRACVKFRKPLVSGAAVAIEGQRAAAGDVPAGPQGAGHAHVAQHMDAPAGIDAAPGTTVSAGHQLLLIN